MLRQAQPQRTDEADVWPDNWTAVVLFMSIQTQWRVGPGGPIGLDYNVLHHKLARMNLDDEDYAELECDIQVMEAEALARIHEKDG